MPETATFGDVFKLQTAIEGSAINCAGNDCVVGVSCNTGWEKTNETETSGYTTVTTKYAFAYAHGAKQSTPTTVSCRKKEDDGYFHIYFKYLCDGEDCSDDVTEDGNAPVSEILWGWGEDGASDETNRIVETPYKHYILKKDEDWEFNRSYEFELPSTVTILREEEEIPYTVVDRRLYEGFTILNGTDGVETACWGNTCPDLVNNTLNGDSGLTSNSFTYTIYLSKVDFDTPKDLYFKVRCPHTEGKAPDYCIENLTDGSNYVLEAKAVRAISNVCQDDMVDTYKFYKMDKAAVTNAYNSIVNGRGLDEDGLGRYETFKDFFTLKDDEFMFRATSVSPCDVLTLDLQAKTAYNSNKGGYIFQDKKCYPARWGNGATAPSYDFVKNCQKTYEFSYGNGYKYVNTNNRFDIVTADTLYPFYNILVSNATYKVTKSSCNNLALDGDVWMNRENTNMFGTQLKIKGIERAAWVSDSSQSEQEFSGILEGSSRSNYGQGYTKYVYSYNYGPNLIMNGLSCNIHSVDVNYPYPNDPKSSDYVSSETLNVEISLDNASNTVIPSRSLYNDILVFYTGAKNEGSYGCPESDGYVPAEKKKPYFAYKGITIAGFTCYKATSCNNCSEPEYFDFNETETLDTLTCPINGAGISVKPLYAATPGSKEGSLCVFNNEVKCWNTSAYLPSGCDETKGAYASNYLTDSKNLVTFAEVKNNDGMLDLYETKFTAVFVLNHMSDYADITEKACRGNDCIIGISCNTGWEPTNETETSGYTTITTKDVFAYAHGAKQSTPATVSCRKKKPDNPCPEGWFTGAPSFDELYEELKTDVDVPYWLDNAIDTDEIIQTYINTIDKEIEQCNIANSIGVCSLKNTDTKTRYIRDFNSIIYDSPNEQDLDEYVTEGKDWSDSNYNEFLSRYNEYTSDWRCWTPTYGCSKPIKDYPEYKTGWVKAKDRGIRGRVHFGTTICACPREDEGYFYIDEEIMSEDLTNKDGYTFYKNAKYPVIFQLDRNASNCVKVEGCAEGYSSVPDEEHQVEVSFIDPYGNLMTCYGNNNAAPDSLPRTLWIQIELTGYGTDTKVDKNSMTGGQCHIDLGEITTTIKLLDSNQRKIADDIYIVAVKAPGGCYVGNIHVDGNGNTFIQEQGYLGIELDYAHVWGERGETQNVSSRKNHYMAGNYSTGFFGEELAEARDHKHFCSQVPGIVYDEEIGKYHCAIDEKHDDTERVYMPGNANFIGGLCAATYPDIVFSGNKMSTNNGEFSVTSETCTKNLMTCRNVTDDEYCYEKRRVVDTIEVILGKKGKTPREDTILNNENKWVPYSYNIIPQWVELKVVYSMHEQNRRGSLKYGRIDQCAVIE